MKIFLSIICLISFAFSSNMVFSKYSKDFLEKNVLPGLQNEGLKIYYVNCYDKLVYSDEEISNNGWVIPEECNMFKYPIKSNIDNKILQIGNINKEKISLLKEQIFKIKEKEIEVQTKLEQDFKNKDTKSTDEKPIEAKNSNILEDKIVISEYKLLIIIFILLLISFIVYKKYNKKTKDNQDTFNIDKVSSEEITKDEIVIEKNIDVKETVINIDSEDLEEIIKDRIDVEKNEECEECEECEEHDEECVCRKYNIRFKKERNLNV